MNPTLEDRYAEIAARFRDAGQDHVFERWDALGPGSRESLLEQAESIDLDLVARFATMAPSARTSRCRRPIAVVRTNESLPGLSRRDAVGRGETLLATGRVGVFLVAGGQGSRLGFEGPKGCLPVGPLSGRTLFEIHAGKIVKLQEKHGRAIPWYIMTSRQNDEATREHFESHGYFGLDRDAVLFMPQSMLPALDADGKLILESPDAIFMSPSGHGGAYSAFLERGGIADAERRGVDTIFYFQVDNPLVRIADPLFLGMHDHAGAEMSLEVLAKTGPDEKIGVVALEDGKPTVVEYSDLGAEEAGLRDANGQLVYWAGSIAIHLFRLDFMRRVAEGDVELPFHVASKEIAADRGRKVAGRKFETFVFDALPSADPALMLEVRREREFAPIKNATGVDSLETGRAMMIDEHRRWLRELGIEVRGAVEISPYAALCYGDLAGALASHRGRTYDGDVRIELDAKGRVELFATPSAR